MSPDETRAAIEAVPDTPVLLLDLDALRRNVEGMAVAARAAGKRLRPHAKTHKMLEVARMQLAAGAAGLQVAKVGEAEALLPSGVTDLLIGYPVVGAPKIARLMLLAERARVAVSVDSLEVAGPIAQAAHDRGVAVGLLLEVDTGLARTGVPPGQRAVELGARLADLRGATFDGVMTHEGQALLRAEDRAGLEREALAAADAMVALADDLRGRGLDCRVVSMGATCTVRADLGVAGVTEVRPGTYVFNDATTVAHGAAAATDVAVRVVATVVSRQAPDRAVIDAGSKVLSSDRLNVRDAPVSFGYIDGLPGHVVVRLTEEHGILAIPADSPLRVGDRAAVVPAHVCPAVNLADHVLVAESGRIVDRWAVVARGMVQ